MYTKGFCWLRMCFWKHGIRHVLKLKNCNDSWQYPVTCLKFGRLLISVIKYSKFNFIHHKNIHTNLWVEALFLMLSLYCIWNCFFSLNVTIVFLTTLASENKTKQNKQIRALWLKLIPHNHNARRLTPGQKTFIAYHTPFSLFPVT